MGGRNYAWGDGENFLPHAGSPHSMRAASRIAGLRFGISGVFRAHWLLSLVQLLSRIGWVGDHAEGRKTRARMIFCRETFPSTQGLTIGTKLSFNLLGLHSFAVMDSLP
jgi:hypothetical protein